ncbi:MAG: phosphate ABC transporter permease [Pirellula sp.]|nr:phosphate ABC transporter permease [Pirellula sp.]
MRDEELVVQAGHTSRQYWRDLWHYRELFLFLAWRDLTVRYKQTSIGVAWALLRPLLTMIIFTVLFGKLAKLPSPGDIPYPLLVMAGMLPWTFFASALAESAQSILNNSNLISKIYFPRLITPAAVVLVTFVDLIISGTLLAGLMIWYRHAPPLQVLLLPIFLVEALAAALGAGLWLSALTVKYRDFRYIIPFLVQFGLYISPVGFSTDIVPEQYRLLFALNPMSGIIEAFRWSLLGTDSWRPLDQLISLAVTSLLLVTGFRYFRGTERQFADTI